MNELEMRVSNAEAKEKNYKLLSKELSDMNHKLWLENQELRERISELEALDEKDRLINAIRSVIERIP
jgi:regulator of replication initiation timing